MARQSSKRTPIEASSKGATEQTLASYLSSVREVKRLTLREVEEATGRQVSNAYLSQLEKGKISKPSPNVLHSLALAYGIAYDTLMEKAGYATGTEALRSAQGSSSKARKNALTDEDLTNEEELKLLEYLAFIRRK
jgi:HTH-type transcriptional regulator, competence development regulator